MNDARPMLTLPQLEVLWAIISVVTIDVMSRLRGGQGSPELASHDQTMLQDVAATDRDRNKVSILRHDIDADVATLINSTTALPGAMVGAPGLRLRQDDAKITHLAANGRLGVADLLSDRLLTAARLVLLSQPLNALEGPERLTDPPSVRHPGPVESVTHRHNISTMATYQLRQRSTGFVLRDELCDLVALEAMILSTQPRIAAGFGNHPRDVNVASADLASDSLDTEAAVEETDNLSARIGRLLPMAIRHRSRQHATMSQRCARPLQ